MIILTTLFPIRSAGAQNRAVKIITPPIPGANAAIGTYDKRIYNTKKAATAIYAPIVPTNGVNF